MSQLTASLSKASVGSKIKKKAVPNAMVEGLEQRRLLSVAVLSWHNDAGLTGLNSNEVSLTPANVTSSSFGELLSYPVTGQVYAQPLYVPNLNVPGVGVVNVVFVATQNNDVYAFNANNNTGPSGGLIWHVNLGLAASTPNSYFANRYGPYHDINPQVGITSTPVIDLASGTIYVDAFTNDVAGQNVYSHHIHALSLTTGADKVAPALVAAAVQGNGVGGNGSTVTFVAEQQLQRPALTLLNGVLYVTYGGFADTDPYHGWVLGFNPATLQLQSVFNTTPNLLSSPADDTAGEGGIWQGGAGLASDGTNLFLMVGNGDFNAALGDYGDSILKLSTDTTTSAAPGIDGYGLHVSDYFTPFNQQQLSDADEDLGSGGSIVLPDQPGLYPHELIGTGKQGLIYVINRDNMGKNNVSTDDVIQTVNLGVGSFSTPAYFNSAIYYQGTGDVLKKYTLTNGLLSAAPSAQTTIAYSYPGANPSISSNGTANGIVWDIQYDGSHAVLYAYDAGTLAALYNSNQNAARDQLGPGVKFASPTIADGEVFVGTSGALTIYGLLAQPTTAPAAPSALSATASSASNVVLKWVDNASNESGVKIDRSTDGVTFTQIALASANATAYTDSSVSPNTQYYYKISATNVIGDSAFTSIVSAKTPSGTNAIDVYHFDEGTGTTTADSAGSNPGTLVGAVLPQWVSPGYTGTSSLSFSGDGTYNQTANESAVQVGDLSPILGSTSTLDVWIKTTQVGASVHYQSPAITGVEQQYGVNDINWGTLDNTGRIGIYVGDSGGVYSINPINDGTWHNVAMTRDASTGLVQLYVDGVLNGSATLDTGNKTSHFSAIGELTDVKSDGATRTGGNFFNGQLDELRIYNTTLGLNDIQNLALVPTAPVLQTAIAAAGPVVHLTFSSGSAYAQSIEIDRKTGSTGTYAPIATVSGTATSYDDVNVIAGVTYYYVAKAIDTAGTSPVSNAISVSLALPTIVANSIFYNNSKFDGQNGSSNLTDDNAVATDKVALLPGQTASFANVTSYSKGINGIIIDIANLIYLPRVDDFSFLVGNNNNPSTWTAAPAPTYLNTYPGRGPGGSTQITLIWNDNAIQNEWLQVTAFAQPHLNLAANDVFYFGNAIGDAGADTNDAIVTSANATAIANNQTTNATVTNPYDINRDGVVDANDTALATANVTTRLTALNLISLASNAPAAPAGLTAAGSGGSISLNWTASANATSYNIYRGTSANGEAAVPIATGIKIPIYLDNTVTFGTTYYYFVTAVNSALAPLSNESAPSAEVFATAPATNSAFTIQAENYDAGGEGVGYHSLTTVNQGGAYRSDGIGIEATTDTGGGYDVGWTQAGEWLNYTFTVPATGFFTFSPRVASPNAGGTFHISIDSVNVSGAITVPSTGAWQTFTTLTTGPVLLAAGTHVMRVTMDTPPPNSANIFNLNYITLTPVAAPTNKLTGTPIGTSTSWNNNGDTIAQVFDGNLNTFFDAANNSLTNWVGLDLGSPQAITQIKFAPRAGYEWRMLGGQFQVSSTPDFSANVSTIYTITTAPVAGQLTAVSINPAASYRYVRYVGGTGWVNIAEMEVDGLYVAPVNTTIVPLVNPGFESAAITTTSNGYDQVIPGWTLNSTAGLYPNGSTAWSSPTVDGTQAIALQGYSTNQPGSILQTFTALAGVYSVSFLAAQRTAYYSGPSPLQPVAVLIDGVNVGTISPTTGTFKTYTSPLFTLAAGTHTLTLAATLNGNDQTTFVDDVAINIVSSPAVTKLTGTPIGTTASWAGSGDTISQVFDGSFTSFFDAANNNLTNWVGLDLGSPQLIAVIKYAPRAGYEYRMVGGQFQASSTPDFSSNVVTLYTITTAPLAGQFTTVNVGSYSNYRYVRYVGGTNWVNIAELEVDGIYTAPAITPVKLTGTPIGTPTSYLNNGDTIAQVFDGNFNTYYDAPNNSLTNWVGLDLGSAKMITQIKYAPRAGEEFRMVGGQFQVSTTADFSSNVTTIYTITTAPVAGQFTTVNVSIPTAYRYIRYIGGTQWVNIAEMEVDGLSN